MVPRTRRSSVGSLNPRGEAVKRVLTGRIFTFSGQDPAYTRQMRQSMHVSQHSCLSELSRRTRAKLQISIKILFSKGMVRLCTIMYEYTCFALHVAWT